MRPSKFAAAFLVSVIVIQSCKPKDKTSVKDLFNKGSDSVAKQLEQKNLTSRDLIVGKWRITDALPPPSEQEKNEMINSILEFTKEGKIIGTTKGKTEEVASFTLSFDEKYLLSKSGDHEDMDTLLIQELNLKRLVLVSAKDNKTLIAERSN